MLVRYITRVRRADPAVRTRHAFFWAVGITGIAAALWAVTLPSVLRPLPDGSVVSDAPRPWSSFFARAKEQLAAVGGAVEDSVPEGSTTTTTEATTAATPAGALELSPEALAEARARAAIEYTPSTTTATATAGISMSTSSATGTPLSNQPRVVRIATTSRAVASTTASTTR